MRAYDYDDYGCKQFELSSLEVGCVLIYFMFLAAFAFRWIIVLLLLSFILGLSIGLLF